MILRLALTDGCDRVPPESQQHAFDETGGTIGRSPRRDWVLPDPDRVVSGKHAAVDYRDGRFFITDHSTNGVFINGSEDGLGEGNSAELTSGDRVRLGDYEFVAEIILAPDPDAVLGVDAGEQDTKPWPFEETPEVQHFALPENFTPQFADNWKEGATGHLPELDGSVEDLGRIAAQPAEPESPQRPLLQSESPQPADDQDSPRSTPTIPWSLAAPGSVNLEALAGADNGEGPFAADSTKNTAVTGKADATQPRMSPGRSPADLIPEDRVAPAQSGPREPTTERNGYRQTSPSVEDAPPSDHPERDPHAPAQRRTPSTDDNSSGLGLAESTDEHGASPEPLLQPLGTEREGEPSAAHLDRATAAESAPDSTSTPSSVGERKMDAETALRHLLDGAGIGEVFDPAMATPEFFAAVGELIALYAQASAVQLLTIGKFKNTFHIDQTQFEATENNPLRCPPDMREPVRRLLSPGEGRAYLEPRDAVLDANARIAAHGMGAVRGIQATLAQLLDDLSPEKLEREFERQGKPLPWANKKAWNWQQYLAYHEQRRMSSQDNPMLLAGDAFSKAYEAGYDEEVRSIRKQSRQRGRR